jgi:hypothetical protein
VHSERERERGGREREKRERDCAWAFLTTLPPCLLVGSENEKKRPPHTVNLPLDFLGIQLTDLLCLHMEVEQEEQSFTSPYHHLCRHNL